MGFVPPERISHGDPCRNQWRSRRGGGGGGRPPDWKIQGKLFFQGKLKLLKIS